MKIGAMPSVNCVVEVLSRYFLYPWRVSVRSAREQHSPIRPSALCRRTHYIDLNAYFSRLHWLVPSSSVLTFHSSGSHCHLCSSFFALPNVPPSRTWCTLAALFSLQNKPISSVLMAQMSEVDPSSTANQDRQNHLTTSHDSQSTQSSSSCNSVRRCL